MYLFLHPSTGLGEGDAGMSYACYAWMAPADLDAMSDELRLFTVSLHTQYVLYQSTLQAVFWSMLFSSETYQVSGLASFICMWH